MSRIRIHWGRLLWAAAWCVTVVLVVKPERLLDIAVIWGALGAVSPVFFEILPKQRVPDEFPGDETCDLDDEVIS